MYQYETLADSMFDVRTRMGDEWLVMCTNPAHDNVHTPAMCVNVEKGVYYCYACGYRGSYAKGHAYDSVEEYADSVVNQINKLLAGASDPPLAKWNKSILSRYNVPNTYWSEERKLDADTIEKFELGFDYIANAATIPCYDFNGELYGVTRRFVDDLETGNKYKNPRGWKKKEHLFGAHLARGVDSTTVVLVEGQIDAMKAWQAGYVGLSQNGSGISELQVNMLARLGTTKVIMCYDNDTYDKAGKAGKLKAKGLYEENGKWKYHPEKDISNIAALYAVDWKRSMPKDLGAMTDRQIVALIESAHMFIPREDN